MAFDPISWAADLGSGILNTATGWIAQNHQNKVNAREAAKQRDWESAEAKKQRDFATEMWNMNNAYNTPAEQRKRLQAAGYNPNIRDTQNVGNGVATSSGSTPSGASASTPLSPQNGPFGSNINKFAESGLMHSQSMLVGAQTMEKLADAYARIYQTMGRDAADQFVRDNPVFENINFEGSIAYRDMIADVLNKEYVANINKIKFLVEEKFGLKRAESEIGSIEQSIVESAARIGKMASDRAVNEATISELAAREAKEIAEKYHLNADAATINAIRGSLASKYESEARMASYDEGEASAEYENRKLFRKWKRSADAINRRSESERESNKYSWRQRRIKSLTSAISGKDD